MLDLAEYADQLFPQQNADESWRGKDYGYGQRGDGSFKGPGFMGELARPDGGISTELSITVNLGGKEVDIPTLVPSLTKDEVDTMLKLKPEERIPKGIVDKAVAHAKKRIDDGKSPFFGAGDE